MKIIETLSGVPSGGGSVVLLGKFDGMHLGHHELLSRAKEIVQSPGLQLVIFMIRVSPAAILSAQETASYLAREGTDLLVRVPLNRELMTMGPEAFVAEILCNTLNACYVVVGEDYRFGYQRSGDTALLADLGEKYGFRTEVIPPLTADGVKISSTRIRAYLEDGKIEKANSLLGYTYYLSGEVVHGRALGRTIGVPTANVIPDPDKFLPRFGVYISRTYVSGKVFGGITNIGCKPTVDGQVTGAETYLFDCDEDLYGSYEKTELLHFVRPEIRFGSVEELKKQLHTDIAKGRSYFL